jgi:hypothetical protein
VDVRGALLAALLLALAPAGRAEEAKPIDVTVGPVMLQIVKTDSGESELHDGGRVLVKDFIVDPGLAGTFNDVQARVFEISQGGNACEGWPAIVTVDKDRTVNIDTTLKDACGTFTASADLEGFTFVEAVVPGQDGSVWRFTPGRGLRKLGDLIFRPQPNTTWGDLDKMLDHPLSLFSCAPFDAAVHRLTGRQYADLAIRLHVASEVEQKGDYLIAQGCQAHACNSDQGFIAIDRKAHKVFLAMRSEKDVTTWPKLANWPARLRDEFKAWQKPN